MKLMTEADYLLYEKQAKLMSRNLAGKRKIDFLGNDQEDYYQELLIASWNAQEKYREKYGFCETGERRFVSKALWNQVRNYKRNRYVAHDKSLQYMALNKDPESYDMGAQVLSRLELGRLFAGLRRDESELLRRVALVDGNVAAAHVPEDGVYSGFRRKVRKAQDRAVSLSMV